MAMASPNEAETQTGNGSVKAVFTKVSRSFPLHPIFGNYEMDFRTNGDRTSLYSFPSKRY
jgi:hypothetical protein